MLPFTREFAATPAERFIEEVLIGKCRARYLACGHDFSFGQGGRGDVAMLREYATRAGFEVDVLDAVEEGSSIVSSSRVRQALLQGHVEEAASLLTRPYALRGEVVPGEARGRTIGYPTANLKPPLGQLIPAVGVYAVAATIDPERADSGEPASRWGGMLNIGYRPTFDGRTLSIEAHLFDFSGELVGRTVEIEFLRRIRDEMKFSGIGALTEQLRRDEQTCRRIWSAGAPTGMG
jgi:riboflavin kinase/FMN adenylyltransferase